MNELRFAEYKTYNEAEIMALYSSVGWSNYTNNPAMLRKAYKNSLYVLAAYADEKLVGILRAVGDGASIVFLQDLIVLPEFQRHGIGSQLMQRVMEKYADVYQLQLLTEASEKNIAFYEFLGLKKSRKVWLLRFYKMRMLTSVISCNQCNTIATNLSKLDNFCKF